MKPETYQLLKLTFGVIATVGLYTVLYKENKFYRFFEHVFLGLAAGWTLVAIWTETLYDSWWSKIMGSTGAANGYWAYALLLPIGLMGYFVFSKKHNWMSRIPIGIILGLWSGQQIQVWWKRYGPQLADSVKPIFPSTTSSFTVPGGSKPTPFEAAQVYPSQAICNLIFVITLLSVLSYFLFSFDLKNRFLKNSTTMGRWLLMVGFGAIFGSTVMMRFTLLIDRMYFIWIEWFMHGLLHKG